MSLNSIGAKMALGIFRDYLVNRH